MLDVAAAVICDHRGRILLCRRSLSGEQAGLWEFPGGKLEPGETAAQALARECLEELGAAVEVGPKLLETVHAYPEREIRLTFLAARIVTGQPQALVHAEISWIAPSELSGLELCQADQSMAAKLAKGDATIIRDWPPSDILSA